MPSLRPKKQRICFKNYFPEKGWQSCQNLHEPLEGGQLINDPETGDLLLLGGRNGNNDQNTIYRLSDIDGEWMLEEQTMMKVGTMQYNILEPDIVCVGESVYVVCSECDKAGGGKTGRQEPEPVKGWPGHNNKCGLLVCDRWLPG